MKRQWAKAAFAVLAITATTWASGPVVLAAPRSTAQAGEFPVSVQSADGTVTISHRPSHILSLSASATQMLYAIGAGSQVVGVDKYSWYPPNAPKTKFTGGETNAEDYLYLHPDLVLLGWDTSLVKQLKVLGIPTLVLPAATNFANVDSQLVELGEATGHLAGARQVEASLSATIAKAVRTAGKAVRGQSYYVEVGTGYYTATSKTFIGAELSLFGLRDIADAVHGSAWPQISAEYILKQDPQWVFLADTVCCQVTPNNFAERPGFSTLQAVRLHHVVVINDSVAAEWGPHSIELLLDQLSNRLRS